MDLLKKGKTKNVFRNPDGTLLLCFKDDATGRDGIFDPGENQIMGAITGKARAGVRFSEYFFKKILAETNIPTHFISADPLTATMSVRPATTFGDGLEIICRPYATGSFYRRYGRYVEEGAYLNYLVEITLKDDERNDPPATEDTLIKLKLLKPGEYDVLKDYAERITQIVMRELLEKDLLLYDIKFEFGFCDDQIALIDEISPDCLRAYRGGERVENPLELEKLFFVDET